MIYTSYTKANYMTQCQISMEVTNTIPMIQQMYDDICSTIGCYKPMLNVVLFGNLCVTDEGFGLSRTGLYTPPSTITIALIDIYVCAYDHGKTLGIFDMDILFKAEVAHTLIHELSHSMQNTFVPTEVTFAMEWANEKNVWNNLYPIVSPMLRKKYKIKLYEETVDITVGRVYTYSYQTSTDLDVILYTLLSLEFGYNNDQIFVEMKTIKNAENVTINIEKFGQLQSFEIIKNGCLNTLGISLLRTFMNNILCEFNYKYSMTDLRSDGKHLVINVSFIGCEQEIFFDPNGPFLSEEEKFYNFQ